MNDETPDLLVQAWRDYSDRYAAGNSPAPGTDIREAFAAGWDARAPRTETPDLRAVIEAAWGGWERPSDDPGILRAIADWMDRLDDVADGMGPKQPVSRAMQDDLRRIARATPETSPDRQP